MLPLRAHPGPYQGRVLVGPALVVHPLSGEREQWQQLNLPS